MPYEQADHFSPRRQPRIIPSPTIEADPEPRPVRMDSDTHDAIQALMRSNETRAAETAELEAENAARRAEVLALKGRMDTTEKLALAADANTGRLRERVEARLLHIEAQLEAILTTKIAERSGLSPLVVAGLRGAVYALLFGLSTGIGAYQLTPDVSTAILAGVGMGVSLLIARWFGEGAPDEIRARKPTPQPPIIVTPPDHH